MPERPPPVSDAVVWHDVECGGYTADLATWRHLAGQCGDPVLDVGAGTGRVALDLARAGHRVVALDLDRDLLAELDRRAAGLPVESVEADAREFDLGRRFPLIIVPMQTIQILGGEAGRGAFLRCAHAHLQPGGRLAVALAPALEEFHPVEGSRLPLPDMAEREGRVYASQPVAIVYEQDATVIERERLVVEPDGSTREEHNEVRLDLVDADGFGREAQELGYHVLVPYEIEPTDEYVGSTVVVLTA